MVMGKRNVTDWITVYGNFILHFMEEEIPTLLLQSRSVGLRGC
jgi:hypothetical protein